MWPAIAAAVSAALGKRFTVDRCAPVGGGCINAAHRVEGGGDAYFVKTNSADKRGMFAAEATALRALSATRSLRVPGVVCHGGNDSASWLVLEYIPLSARGDFAMLGHQLAALHRVSNEVFGWQGDNVLGATPQVNTPGTDWVAFWREHRLGYQLRLAAENGHRGSLQRDGERLMARLADVMNGHRPMPSLLHGDLWSGNLAFGQAGEPVVFDPAVYYGDREADLAMTELFGRLPEVFYAAYREAFPLADGYARRRDLYNLYHVLNHLNLFGGGYRAQAETMIKGLLAS